MKKETVIQLETMIDHLTGEEAGLALNFLNDMPETLDAILIPAIGKKNRPCHILQVLCMPEKEEELVRAVFRHTHSLGLRRMRLERYVLPRETAEIDIDGKMTKVKIYTIEGESYIRPESDFIRNEAQKESLGAPAFRIMKKEAKKE